MYFLALATDYDGTIATDGEVDTETLAALEAFKRTGRRLILVTGRRVDSLRRAFPRLKLFERVVAENGAVLFDPVTEEERSVASEPSPDLIARLRERGVTPLSVGKSIIATRRPNETIVLEAIRELGLELQIVFTTLFKRLPNLRLAVPFEEIEFTGNNTQAYGVHSLPVAW